MPCGPWVVGLKRWNGNPLWGQFVEYYENFLSFIRLRKKNIVITRFDIGGGLLNKRRRKEKKKCNENRLLDMQLMKVIHRQCCKFEQAGHFLDVKEMQNGPLNKSTAFRFHFSNNHSSKDNKNTNPR